MIISDKVKEMSIEELHKLRATIRVQFEKDEVTLEDYLRGDMTLVNLLLVKEA